MISPKGITAAVKPRSRKKKKSPKRVLALPDLEQAKSAVLNTLTSKSGQRTYDHTITEFVEWYLVDAFEVTSEAGGGPKTNALPLNGVRVTFPEGLKACQ